jgi:selenide,water dikinase
MGPEALAQVLRPLAETFDAESYPDLLRGLASPDDAAVWRLSEEQALVLSADFFPPVVDDPYQFGAIAAANALSDLYAMGAEPLVGINLVGFPDNLDRGILAEILRGGADKAREAGAVIAGGHTTNDHEPKYGLAVMGVVHPSRIWEKGGARDGDRLFLTKPIGTGIVTTAHKRGSVGNDDLAAAVESMSRLHRGTVKVLRSVEESLHAATDVTGFSLGGHAHEMAHQSGLSLRLHWEAVPRLPGVERYARAGEIPGGGRRNRDFYQQWTRVGRELADWEEQLLYDPQTSGGLLLAIAPDRAEETERALRDADEPVWRVGEAQEGPPGSIELV